MKVGIVTKWFNRGQPVVGRYVRSAMDELGHESFVLARPRREKGPMAGALERTDVWDQPGVTEASRFEVPLDEYLRWVDDNAIEAILCDQNYQFAELAELRGRGVRVIGRFVWEHFTADHVAGAREAYDLVYSLTECERRRYRTLGLETPKVEWGIHPELLEYAPEEGEAEGDAGVWFVFPGGFLGHRKPLEPVVEAFRRTGGEGLRLLIKAQVDRSRLSRLLPAIEADPRIELALADEPRAQHLRRIAACDVCIAVARWEGLGLPLYEATAFGMPVITNDVPPMNEVIREGVNGVLVGSHEDGTARSGIPAYNPDIDDLAAAIERLGDPEVRSTLAAGARTTRERLSWARTVSGLGGLLDQAAAAPSPP
jgi:1,2-diacylglycerol 3-alpha-glucosyltransferase